MAFTFNLGMVLIILFIVNFYLVNKNKIEITIYLAIILLTFFPVDAIGIISGSSYNTSGILNISLLSYDVIILFLVLMLNNKKIKIRKKHFEVIILMFLFMILIRTFIDKMNFFSNKIVENYLGPIILLFIILSFIDTKDKCINLIRCLYICILINSFLACIEYFIGKSIFFHEYYINNVPWYNNVFNSTKYQISFRSTSLLGHPLTNAIYFLIGLVIALNFNFKKFNKYRIIMIAVLMFAIFTTNSRSMIALALIYMVYWLMKNKKMFNLALITTIVIIFMLSNIDFLELYMKIFKRDATGQSLMIRIESLHSFFEIPFKVLFLGTGFNNAMAILNSFSFTTNLEISYLIILLENGILGFIAWIILILSTMKLNIKNKNIKDSVIVFLIACLFSNSIGDSGTLNYTLWILLGLSNITYWEEREKNEYNISNKKNKTKN